MRIVFFGSPELAVPSLEAAATAHEVTALVCPPDKPQGRRKTPAPPPTKVWAEGHGIEINQPTKLNDGVFEAWLREQAPDVCVLVAYGRILKQPILDVPPHGFLNVHPSLLPRHRGPSPIQTAILEGDIETGVTIMRLDAGTDTGDVLLHEVLPIEERDTSETLSAKLAELGARALLEALSRVESGDALFTPQDDTQATHSKMFSKENGRIRWDRPAREIHNLVRACVPWPVAHCGFNGNTVRIYKTSVVAGDKSANPGSVIHVDKKSLYAAAGEDAIAVETIQAPGKKAISIAEFLRGNTVEVGDRFEDL